jgi:hypothetical protein
VLGALPEQFRQASITPHTRGHIYVGQSNVTLIRRTYIDQFL